MESLSDFNEVSDNYFGFQQVLKNGSSFVLDTERGELQRVLARPGQKAATSKDKALMALRNHSEAERRRRERINGHLATLRSLIPGTDKMDKAALLAEVTNKVKDLKQVMVEATDSKLIPTEINEVKVEQQEIANYEFAIQASLCCNFKHEVLSDLREALASLPLKMVRAEIATFGNRMVNVVVLVGCNEDEKIKLDKEIYPILVDSVREALNSVLDKFNESEDLSLRNSLSNKRRRGSFFSPSNSSSIGDFL